MVTVGCFAGLLQVPLRTMVGIRIRSSGQLEKKKSVIFLFLR
jgi:hypothetical protein